MKFRKMHGAGNDFVLLDGREDQKDDYTECAKKVCHRHFSVGADGLMVAKNSSVADIKMKYYNSDGSEGEMCGNGIRCFSRFVYEKGMVNKQEFTVETLAGIQKIFLELEKDHVQSVKVKMSHPIFEPKKIPVLYEGEKVLLKKINIDGKDIEFSTIFLGVIHTVIFVEDINRIDINDLGEKIENHPLFPQKTNVNFIQIDDKKTIHIYTWERGAGRTLACGTGCCASVVVGNILGKLENKVKVYAEGGVIEIQIMDNYDVYMKGNATTICEGLFVEI